ncbi:MAG: hypothetical protein V3T17_16980, partial [Pseudomonadales bacterium]
MPLESTEMHRGSEQWCMVGWEGGSAYSRYINCFIYCFDQKSRGKKSCALIHSFFPATTEINHNVKGVRTMNKKTLTA